MDALIILLLIIILIVLVKFKNYVTENFKKTESELQQLKKRFTEPQVTTDQTITPTVAEGKAKKVQQDYWESSFKKLEDPIIIASATNVPYEEKITPEPAKEKEQIIYPVLEETKFSESKVRIPKLSFFEKNPDLEKFIGENLVSKIGIAILVLAIGFFVKFAIDNNWIGPVARVAVGILCGAILVFLAHRLRAGYKAFSSVLVGGGLAVFYFTITLAYHQFHLFSQSVAFIIMIIITIFAVVLALLYDRQELAVIALVGGFAAPFLVSDGSGNYKVLFTYLIILNGGLLIIAYYKAWRLMNVLAFIFTVLLFSGWLFSLTNNAPADTYGNGVIFATIFYLLFFFINIANNIKENKKFIAADFSILLINTAWFFATGLYCITEMNKPEYRGLLTILIGVFNLVASYFLLRKRKVDTNVLYLLVGITLTFVSLTAPIQLNGNNITLFWASEAVLLYWLFQKSKIHIIQYASLIIWFAMIVSLVMDWVNIYSNTSVGLTIIANKGFITGFYCAVASYILFILRNKSLPPEDNFVAKIISKNIFRVAGIILLFLSGALEVNYQFNFYFPEFSINILYLLLYIFTFLVLLLFINSKVQTIKIPTQLQVILLISGIALYLFTLGIVSHLQDQLLNTGQSIYFNANWIIAVLVGIIFYKLIQLERTGRPIIPGTENLFIWLACGVVIIFLSFESFWITKAIFYNNKNSVYHIQTVFIKTCLPILWGLCSFGFMWLGMRYKFKPLRIISLVLFLLTLLKLFIFDISNIPAAGKIAAFFCLGVLLLIVSFMYQRLKRLIILDEQNKPA